MNLQFTEKSEPCPGNSTISIELLVKLMTLGFFFMPFENLVVAPSGGWPAVSPVIFGGVAMLLLIRGERTDRRLGIICTIGLLLSSMGWAVSFLGNTGNRFFMRDVLGAILPMIMGIGFYFPLRYFLLSSNSRCNYFRRFVKAYITGAWIALAVSVFILLVSQIHRMDSVVSLISIFLRRNKDLDRFCFLFAEPSFVSVHILGVQIPLIWMAWRLGMKSQMWQIIKVMACYIGIAFIFLESARFLVDMAFLGGMFMVFHFSKSMFVLNNWKLILAPVLIFIILALMVSQPIMVEKVTMGRVKMSGDFSSVMNSDASLASRYFRTEAVYHGIADNPHFLLTGVGFGNIGTLVDLGFGPALANFTSFFRKEVDDMALNGSGSNMFNMHSRLIGEFGLLVYLFIIFLLYDRRCAFLFFISAWCYLQFDSYAFYGIWIYLVARELVSIPATEMTITISNPNPNPSPSPSPPFHTK